MIAFLCFFNAREISVEVFLAEKRSPIDPLQLLVLFISQPVRTRNVEELERLDPARRRHMRPAAEIEKLAGFVDRNLLIGLGELLDEMALHEVAFLLEALQALAVGQKLARIRQILRDQLLHLLLDFFQVLGSKRLLAIKVIEEPVLSRRPVAKLGLGE